MRSIKLFALIFLSHLALAQSVSKPIESKVVKVTVFPQGAQVIRTGHTSVSSGKTDLVFGGVSPQADPSSIQVEGIGSFTIISVSSQPNKLREQKKRKEIEEIEKSKETFSRQLIQQKAMLDVYQKEEEMLAANYKVSGENVGLKASDLAAALDLHRTRLHELKFFEIDYTEKIKKIQDTITLIDAQIYSLNANADISTTDLIVSVVSKEPSNADFTISYVVSGAGWYPSYDLHVADISKPLVLSYKANVHQNTGEEWKDVRLIFSNGNPNESGIAPILNPFYIRNLSGAHFKSMKAKDDRDDEVQYSVNSYRKMESSITAGYLNKNQNIIYSDQTQNSTAITFELATPYTVINDGKNRAVDMKQEDIPATFEYFCVPKREKKVFLIAHVINWLDYNLMDGEVNLYYEGTYTGKTAFSLATTEDTLTLSLGVDKGITVSRIQVKDFSKKQILTDKKSVSTAFDINIKNNKKFPIHLVIEDQIPLSTDKEITIENSTYDGASLDEATGKLTWKLDLTPATDKKLKLSYSVKYPKTYRVLID